jgi:prepilin-type N-terminal cleavage/methylation domain-containing protein
MKNTKKAFTLVELIVVITILAVLATVAFISFSGQTKEANKSKVVSDLANLSKAIEISGKGLKDLVGTSTLAVNGVDNAANFANGGVIDSTNYGVGKISFTTLGQNGEEFKDANGDEYIFAYYGSGSFNKYQVVGQVENATGDNETFVKGSYYSVTPATDVAGLVAASGSVVTGSGAGVVNGEDIASASIY